MSLCSARCVAGEKGGGSDTAAIFTLFTSRSALLDVCGWVPV